MSDARLHARWRELESLRWAHLENADSYRGEAERVRQQRDSPPDPTRAYEHQVQSDARVADLTSSAARSQSEAESTLTQMRGLEAGMRTQQRSER